MALQNPALFIQTQSHPAEDVRRYFEASMGDRPGVVEDTDFVVTEAATPAMTVSVSAGRVFVAGDESTYHGLYFAENRGPISVSIATADSTNDRKDLIVVRVKDGNYSGTEYEVVVEAVTGTASASPAEPTLPANSFVLALVDVSAGTSSIVDADITDRRRSQGLYSGNVGGLASSLGGVIPCNSGTRPSSPRAGTTIFEEDAGTAAVYTGSTWRRFAYDDALSIAAPAGLVAMTFASTAPSGWLLCQGQTIANADSTYPDLWAAAPSGWKSGTSLTLPNMKGRFPVGFDSSVSTWNSIGGTGGDITKSLSVTHIPAHTHTGPAHTHSIAHNHASVTSGSGGAAHTHSFSATTASSGTHSHAYRDRINTTASGSSGYPMRSNNSGTDSTDRTTESAGSHTHTVSGTSGSTTASHTHSVDLPNYTGDSGAASYTGDTGSTGSGSSFSILPPFIILNFIVKT